MTGRVKQRVTIQAIFWVVMSGNQGMGRLGLGWYCGGVTRGGSALVGMWSVAQVHCSKALVGMLAGWCEATDSTALGEEADS
ncbi:hypothetical protein JCM14635_25010 [Megalodesulfovibrio paquesii]